MKVSVVIATYNRAGMIAESVDSVLAQNYDDFEVIVVDDGSTDNTQEVLARYKDRIVLVRQSNAGFAAARTAGIKKANSDLIAFHDSDDIMLAGRLEAQVGFMEKHPDVAALSGNMIVEGKYPDYYEGRGIDFGGSDHLIFEKAFSRLLAGNFMADPASIVRRKYFAEAGGYDVSLRSSADWDLWLKISRKRPLACIKRQCTKLRVQRDNLSGSKIQAGCIIRVIDRALGYGEAIEPPILREVLRRLYSLIGYYIVLNFIDEVEPGWRSACRQCAARLPVYQKLFVAFATVLPRGLGSLLARKVIHRLILSKYEDLP